MCRWPFFHDKSMTTSRARWLALIAALLGWMFDGLEMGLFPLLGRPALRDLLGKGTDEKTVVSWFAVINSGFLIGAATGGVLFGWLGDRLGRVRAMLYSVLLYATCSGLCGLTTAAWQLAVARFLGSLGMGGEWALGVALVMEMWKGQHRAVLAGLIGFFGNFGYCVLGCTALAINANGHHIPEWLAAVGLGSDVVEYLTRNSNWRLLMMVGAVPALLTLFIRFFVPEPEQWAAEKASGQAQRWATRDLLWVLLGAALAAGVLTTWILSDDWWLRGAVTLIGTLGAGSCYLRPARNYLRRSTDSTTQQKHTLRRMILAACLSGVPLLATWGGVMWMYNWVDVLAPGDANARPLTQAISAFGSAVGSLLAALLGGSFLGRRKTYAVLCLASALTLYGFYSWNTSYGTAFLVSAGVLGLVTSSFYGWLPLYLPELFRTGVRATGQGFGFNFGRILASIGSLQTMALLAAFDGNYATACSVAAGVYLLGFILIWFAPETSGQPLPE
jgi:MFS transporter, SHS family, sialic acid transporter